MTTRRDVRRYALGAAVLCMSALLSVSCGGGGGGGGSTGGLVATFTATTTTPAANDISMEKGSASGANFNVDIVATDINDFFGAAFTITYPATVAQFSSFDSSASFLRDGAIAAGSLNFQVDAATPGQLRVVATRIKTGAIAGVNVVGTRNLITIRFRALQASAATAIGFSATNREVRSSVQPPAEGAPIAIHAWNGGSVAVAQN